MAHKYNHHVAIIIYKMTADQSKTITSILKNSDLLSNSVIHIWDNSPSPTSFDINALSKNTSLSIKYTHTPENTYLSKIYNSISSKIPESDYLTILDQDTEVTRDFFLELMELINLRHPLILPRIYSNNILVSPGKRFYSKGILLKSITPGLVKSNNMLAINSGTTIHNIVLRNIPYDERLKFYGTDTYFMRNFEKKFAHFYVMHAKINHSLAEFEQKDAEWHISYKREKLRTFDIIFSDSIDEIIFLKLYKLLVSAKLWLTR